MDLLILVVIAVVVLLALVGGTLALRRSRTPSAEAPPVAAPPEVSLSQRLARTRHAVGDRLTGLFTRGDLDEAFWTELEETLIAGDVGVGTAGALVAAVRDSKPADAAEARGALRAAVVDLFAGRERALSTAGTPGVLVVVGVNGTGKTTSIAKLARRFVGDGYPVVLGAADTFRAGASEQLKTWAERVGADFVGGEPNSDPAAVAFRALERGTDTGAGVVIVDTAGRLHSNRNLMEELGKIIRVLTREAGAIDEVLLVLDATTGQNAIAQAHTFTDVVGVTGIILSKLDGTARGGVVLAIEQDLDIPVKLIGVGEGMDDLIAFDPPAFVDALLGYRNSGSVTP